MAAASSSLPVPLSPRISTAEWVTATLRAMAIILRTACARAVDRLEGPKPPLPRRVQRAADRGAEAGMAGRSRLAFGPILELILQDQDPPLLLGDLVDLASQLLIQGLERFLDVGRMQYQRGDRARGRQERHLFVFVRHAAALRAQDEQTGEWPSPPSAAAASPPSAIMASDAGRDAVEAPSRGRADSGGSAQAVDERIIGGERRSSGAARAHATS